MKVEVFKEYTPPHGDEVFEDLIWRGDAIKAIRCVGETHYRGVRWTMPHEYEDAVMAIPAAKPKKGEWIHDTLTAAASDGGLYDFEISSCKCSECGCHVECEANFCPNCGARMVSDEHDN